MTEIQSLADIDTLSESADVECKLAQGRDGQGACPQSLWESISAFANTLGGDIFLGLEENDQGRFTLAGIENSDKVIEEVWQGLNDPMLVSENIIPRENIRTITIDGQTLIHIHVPRANCRQRPIYIKGNPLGGTYLRQHSADIRASDEVVRHMLDER